MLSAKPAWGGQGNKGSGRKEEGVRQEGHEMDPLVTWAQNLLISIAFPVLGCDNGLLFEVESFRRDES